MPSRSAILRPSGIGAILLAVGVALSVAWYAAHRWRTHRGYLLLKGDVPPALATKGYPIGGSSSPEVILLSDYGCLACEAAWRAMADVVSTDDGPLLLRVVILADSTNSYAISAGQAAYCAAEQGAFLAYHDRLFNGEPRPLTDLSTLAHESGVPDIPQFDLCLRHDRYRQQILDDAALANELPISAVPTFILPDGRIVVGVISLPTLLKLLE